MQVLTNLPLLPATAGVFVLVLMVLWLLGRSESTSLAANRVADYTGYAAAAVTAGDVQPLRARPGGGTSLLGRLLAALAVSAPRRLRASTATELNRAGVPVNPDVFLGVRCLLLVALPAATAMWVLSSPQRGPVQWALLGLSVLIAPRLPMMWLRRRVRDNQRAIDRALPYALDLMVACLEGGLSLEASLAKVAEQGEGVLSDQIRRTLQEMTLGRPASEAMRDLGERGGSSDLKRLTENIIQAERMGIGLAQAMRSVAEESRIRRRQRAEENARKAPAKMMPVLIFFILPAMMAVIMAPAAINMSRVFANLHR
jgi:tight adherence protein C